MVAWDNSVAELSQRLLASAGTVTPASDDLGLSVRAIGQETSNCSFEDVGSGLLTSDLTQITLGTGMAVSQAAGSLVLTTGTTVKSEFLARTNRTWKSPLNMRVSNVLSQRIANNNFMYILADLIGQDLTYNIVSAVLVTVTKTAHGFTSKNVGQFMFVGGISGAAGVPGRYAIASIVDENNINFTVAGWPATGTGTLTLFGWNHIKTIYTSTTATAAQVDAQRKGWSSGDTTITTLTSASPGHILQTHFAGRETYWADTLRASTTAAALLSRGSRLENLPNEDVELYLFLWSYNGTVAPATTTTWTVGFVSIEKFASTPVYLQGSELMGTHSPAPVQVVSGTVTATVTAGTVNPVVPATPYFVNSAATTNGALILTGTSGLPAFYATNEGASYAYVKLYNKATAPTVGTDIPEMTIPIPPAAAGVPGVVNLHMGFHGFRFALGLGISITRNAVFSDTTAVGASEVKVKLSRTV